MSKSNENGSEESVKEGLAKLAAPTPNTDSPESRAAIDAPDKWGRTKKAAKLSLLGIGGVGCLTFCAVAGLFLSNPTIRQMATKIFVHSGTTIRWNGGPVWDPSRVYNLTDNFPPDKRKSITVLVLGSDHDTVGKRDPGHIAVPIDVPNAPGRSDAIMLARFEFDGDSISSLNVLSVPRDTRVRVPGRGIHKINAAHAYGGPELVCSTIRDVFHIDPDYYVDLNFEGFQQVVDAVGGVDVDVHEAMNYDDDWGHLHIHLKPGQQHLNGYRAMGYVRFRHTDNDLARAQRQHEFLEALRSRITAPSSFLALPNVVGAVTNNLHSNLTMDQMLTLANLARKAPKDAICLETLPVVEGKTFVYIDRRKSTDVIRRMFFKDRLEAMRDIQVPDSVISPARHRRHAVRDGAPPRNPNHHAATDETDVAKPEIDSHVDDPAAGSSPQPAPDKGAAPDKHEKTEPPAPPSKPEGTTGSDGEKTKPGDGTGTKTGSASAILRG